MSKTTLDLSTLPDISGGTHSITLKATAEGYLDSDISNEVTYTVKEAIPTDCIVFIGDTSDFTLKATNKTWDGTVEYSTDKSTWNTWDGSEVSSANKKLYLRGKNNTKFYKSNGVRLSLSEKAGCYGNINTLLDYENPPTTLTQTSCYEQLFRNCTLLTTAPELPAATLGQTCYRSMFQGCTSLTTPPTLPATTLVTQCYAGMFENCTSLMIAPALPATTLASSCYNGMFNKCTSLTQAPALPATSLAEECYASMFNGCTSLVNAPELPATTLANFCYTSMFKGCTSLKISATQTSEYITTWRIPNTGEITSETTNWNSNMLNGTGGTFTGDPSINTTYYGAWKDVNAGYYITAAHVAYDNSKEETLYLKINDGEYEPHTNDGELLEFENVKTVSFYYVSDNDIEIALYNTDGGYPDKEDPSLSQGDFTSATSPETAKTITITEQSDLIFTVFERD